ncbi:hypothetical protein K439DRAFT_1353782 [Ramaria rubella]|nr:hypothetical protein K439DRAFT_1353782 [Ramaria rubella]
MRVLEPNRVWKLSQLYLVLEDYGHDDTKRFCWNLQVSPETFDALLGRIDTHTIFISSGPQPQLPVCEQLAIALYQFGHFGNSASVESMAQWAGVAAGMVVNCTRQVMVVFLHLHDDVTWWPNEMEKDEVKQRVEEATCHAWRDGFCFVTHTCADHYTDKLGYHGEGYFDRKSNYSLNVQVLISLPR